MSDKPPNKIVISREEFLQMVMERKSKQKHEKEQKLQNDLRRIQEMKSRTGIDPLQLFPKEIWLMILDELNPEDKRNLGQVHELFRGLLGDTFSGSVLLPIILGFKVKRYWLLTEDGLKSRSENSWHSFALYTKLRLVSKTMRNAVDHWLEKELLANFRSDKFGQFTSPLATASFHIFDKREPYNLRKIMRIIESFSDSSPLSHQRFFIHSLHFIYPRVWLPEWATMQFNRLTDTTNALLDIIGSQVWFFSFEVFGDSGFDWSEMSFRKVYTLFFGWLSRMPNLKWLSLRIVLRYNENQYFVDTSEPPPPRLDKLERVDLRCNSFQFVNAILSTNPNIKVMSFLETDSLDYRSIPRIQSLPLEGLRLDPRWGWVKPLQTICSKNWPLKWAYLNFGKGESVSSIFQYLSNYKTLEKLSLEFDNTDLGKDIPFLELPNLVGFDINLKRPKLDQYDDNTSFFMTMQYLLHSGRLKMISWTCLIETHEIDRICENLDNYDHGIARIIYGGSWPDIRKSNIYQIFPALDSIKISLQSCDDKCWKFTRNFNR